MKPSEVKLNRGIVLGFALAYCLTCGIIVGLLHIDGVIIIVASLLFGVIVGIITFLAGKIQDHKLIQDELIEKRNS